MKIPSWLKILGLLFFLSVIFSILGAAISEFLIVPLVLITLILFPGKDAKNPRLVRFIPWIWGLGAAISLVFLLAELIGRPMASPEMHNPTLPELWSTVLLTPPLIWALVRRNRFFRPLLIGSAILFTGLEFWIYSESNADIKAIFELVGGASSELILAIYLFIKVRPEKNELSNQ
jgi:hypothetical protein